MHNKSFYRRILILITLVFAMFFSVHPTTAKEKVIRVGIPMQQGLTMKDKKGNYYGYDYDYLMQIAQYTGWKYEFVEVEGDINERLSTLLEMLKNGEIDIMGGIRYNDALAEIYDYPSQAYGNAYNIIAVNEESNIYDFDSLINKKDLRIAVLKSSTKRIEKLDQFAAMNGFTYEKVFCETDEDVQKAISNKKVDGALYVDLSKPQSYHTVAQFSPDSFYFATTKGNSEVVSKLNQALNNIQQTNPSFSSILYNRYFTGNHNFALSDEEKAYVKKKGTINVLLRNGNAPIQYIKNGESRGIAKDILTYIAKHSDLKFHYIQTNTYEEYQNALKHNDIDLYLGLPYDLNTSDQLNVTLTDPFITTSMFLVTNKNANPNDLTDKKQGTTHFVNQRYDNNTNILNYNSPEEVLQALDDGKVDYAYLNSYLVTYYMSEYRFKNLSTFNAPDYLQSQYAFGIKGEKNNTLVNILNKGIRSSQGDLNTYIYKNGYSDNSFNLQQFIQDNIVLLSILSLGIVILILFFIRIYYRRKLEMKQEVELEYQRYLTLSEVSGEMTFSYDYRLDELKISSSGIHRLADEEMIVDFSKLTNASDSLAQIQQVLKNRTDVYQELEMRFLHEDKKWYRIILKVIRDLVPGSNQAIYAVGRILEIQNEVIEREQLRHKSQTDALTGILNRSGAFDKINEKLSNQEQGTFIMMDLDNFKEINDTFGHLEGDRVLCETADMLKKIFSDQIIGRLGGDEFLIYVDTNEATKICTYCETMLAEINKLPFIISKHLSLSMSIGVTYVDNSTDITELIRLADTSLYQVKRSGRNGYHIYSNK